MKRAGGGKIFWKTSDSDMPVTLEGRSMAMAGALTSQQTGTQGTTEQLALQMKSLFPLRERKLEGRERTLQLHLQQVSEFMLRNLVFEVEAKVRGGGCVRREGKSLELLRRAPWKTEQRGQGS